MEASAENNIAGNIRGVEKMQQKLNDTYAKAALTAQDAFNLIGPSVSVTTAQTVRHSGTIRVEGVNDNGQLVGAYDLIMSEMAEEARM